MLTRTSSWSCSSWTTVRMPRATRMEPSERPRSLPPSTSAHCSESASRSWSAVTQCRSRASLPISASRPISGRPGAFPIIPSRFLGNGNALRLRVQSESQWGGAGLMSDGDDVDRGAEQLLDGGEELLVLDGIPVVLHFIVPAAVAGEDDRELGEVDAGRLLQVLGERPGAAGADDDISRQADLFEDLADLGEALAAGGARGFLVLPIAPGEGDRGQIDPQLVRPVVLVGVGRIDLVPEKAAADEVLE